MKSKSTLRSFLLLAGSSLLAISYSHATTLIWDGDTGTAGAQDVSGTFTWASGDLKFWNGSADVATTDDITTDIAQFGNGGTLATAATVNVSTQSINGLIFGTTATSGYTLSATSAQALTIGGSGITVNSGAQAISVGSANLGITLGAAQSWTNNDNSLLTIGGAVNKAGYLLTITGTGSTTINGKISGAGGLTKDGAGTLTLGANNDFSGGMILNAGTLTGTTAQSFTGGLTVNGGALGTGTWLSNTAVNFMGNASMGNGGTSTILSATIDSAATFTLNAVTSGNSATSLTFTNGLSGSGDLRFTGGTSNTPQPKTLTLNNSSGFTGDLILDYAVNGTTTALNFTSLGDGGKIIYGGGGTRNPLVVTYTGSGNTFDTRQLEFASSFAANTGMNIESNGTGALVFNTALSVTSSTNGKTLTLGGTTVGLNNAFNGVIANGGGTAVITVAKTGASTWIISNTANSYTGGTSLQGGILQFTKTAAMPAAGAVAVGTGTTLVVNAGAASGEWTNATSGNGSIGGLLAGLGGQAGGTVTYSGAVTLGLDTTNATAGTMTYSGVIGNVGTSLGITKLGAGTTLVLDQANTFSGTTTVSAGTLAVNNSLALQNSALVTTSGTSTYAGGASLTIGGLSGASGNLGSANVLSGYTGLVTALTLNPQSGVSVSYGGNIANGSGAMTLTKSGAGTQTLTGTNSYSGGTFISGGTLSINSDGNLGDTSGDISFTGTGIILLNSGSSLTYSAGRTVTVSSGATAIFGDVGINGAIATTVNGQITGDGGVQFGHYQLGTGSADLNSTANDFKGALRIGTSDTLSQTYSGYTVNTASLADASGYGNIIFGRGNGSSGNTGTFAWSNNATSALVLDYRRIELDTTVEKSVLASNSTNTARTVTVNTDLLVSRAGNKVFGLGGTNTGENTFNGLIANSTTPAAVISLEKSGAGTWNVTDASNSYTGGTIVNGGILRFASGALGTAGTINTSGGTLFWLPGNTQDISSRLAMTAATASTFNTYNNNVTFASAIGSSTTGQLVKTGLGTLTLQGTNTFTGTTTLTGGGRLTLDYSTNDTTKLSDTANLVLDGGSLVLKGGTHSETVVSASMTNNNGTFISRESSLSTKINLNVITLTSTQSVLSFSEDNIATTDRLNVAGIMGAWFTVGNRWAANATNAANGNIVGYTGGTTFTPAAATSADINYDLSGSATLTGGRAVNTLRIESTANDQILDLGANTLTVSNLTGTNALAGTSGGLLYAGGANGNYTITGTSSARLTPENGNGQALLINVYSGTLNLDVQLSNSGSTLNKSGEGTLVMQKDNTGFTAATRIYQGALRLTTANATGTNAGGIFVQNGAALELSGGLTFVDDALSITGEGVSSGGALKNVSGANTYQGAITIGNGGARINNADTGNALTVRGITTAQFADVTFGGAGNITHNTTAISGGGQVIKDGTGTLTTSIGNTYTGATNVNAGTFTVASTGTINSSIAINVAAGGTFRYNSSTALTVAPTLAGSGISNRAVLGGGDSSGINGTIGVAVTLDNVGDVLSPGNSPGIQTYTIGQSWASFSYDWEVNDFTGLNAGSDFDQIGITGGLTLTGAAPNSYYLNILSLTAGNVSGLVPNFSEINRSWTILTTTTGIIGFNASYWNVNPTGFTNPETGTWSISQSGNNLVLNYTAVPEPGAAFIGSLGLLALLRRRRS